MIINNTPYSRRALMAFGRGVLLLLGGCIQENNICVKSLSTSTMKANNGINKNHIPSAVSASIIQALQSSYPQDDDNKNDNLKLNLVTDFFDPTTGLHSEGVWHNALAGIALLQQPPPCAMPLSPSQQKECYCYQIAQSLYQFSWDGVSFRRRSWSGQWDHSPLEESSSNNNERIEQSNYYYESSEHRCIQHGMSLIFWSQLLQKREKLQLQKNQSNLIKEQQKETTQQFIQQFWDPTKKLWTTTSKYQGGGLLSRFSASSGKTAKEYIQSSKKSNNSEEEEVVMQYFRAVDQAIAVLACLECLQVLEQSNDDHGGQLLPNKQNLIEIIQITCHNLLATTTDTTGFGYSNIHQARTYINLERNRNFWHDGWVLLALIRARTYIWPSSTNDIGVQQLQSMWKDLLDLYECQDEDTTPTGSTTKIYNSTVWHWTLQQKPPKDNVRYCGDNVLAFAICRNLNIVIPEKNGQFWLFVDQLRRMYINNDDNIDDNQNDNHLASVADVYPQVRLHPNTELAALLVWP